MYIVSLKKFKIIFSTLLSLIILPFWAYCLYNNLFTIDFLIFFILISFILFSFINISEFFFGNYIYLEKCSYDSAISTKKQYIQYTLANGNRISLLDNQLHCEHEEAFISKSKKEFYLFGVKIEDLHLEARYYRNDSIRTYRKMRAIGVDLKKQEKFYNAIRNLNYEQVESMLFDNDIAPQFYSLSYACKVNDLKMVKLLLKNHHIVNFIDFDGIKKEKYIIHNKSIDIAEFLLEQKEYGIPTSSNTHYLDLALLGDLNIIKLILKKTTTNSHCFNTFLYKIVASNNIDCLKYACKTANLDCFPFNINDLLMSAFKFNNVDIIKFILENGVFDNHLDNINKIYKQRAEQYILKDKMETF